MIAAEGTTLSKCGVIPPYKPDIPSSFAITLKHWKRPVYFVVTFPVSVTIVGACRNLVRTTSCGYVITAANSFAVAAAANFPPHSSASSRNFRS